MLRVLHACTRFPIREVSYAPQPSNSATTCTTLGLIEWVVHLPLSMERLPRTGINSTHVYSHKRRTNSKRGEVQAVCGAVVRLCTVFFVVITTAHMAANCGHAECGSRSLLLHGLIETVHNVSTCFFWDYLHTLALQLDSKYSNVSQCQVWQTYGCCMESLQGCRRCLNTLFIHVRENL